MKKTVLIASIIVLACQISCRILQSQQTHVIEHEVSIEKFQSSKEIPNCLKLKMNEIMNNKNQGSPSVSQITLSLKIMNDGFNAEDYSKMEKDELKELARSRPSQNFEFVITNQQVAAQQITCQGLVDSSLGHHKLHFPLLANSGLSATLNYFPKGQNILEGYVCNCDQSFTLGTLRKGLKNDDFGKKEIPSLLYGLEVKRFDSLLIPNKLIPFGILIGFVFIGLTCKKIYDFSADSNTTLSTKQDPLIFYILGCLILNLLGNGLMSLVMVIFFKDMSDQKPLRIISTIFIECSSLALLFLSRKVIPFYPSIKKLAWIFVAIKAWILLKLAITGAQSYMGMDIIYSQVIFYVILWFLLKVLTRKKGVFEMTLGYRRVNTATI